jgi:2-aminoadipate transaminase
MFIWVDLPSCVDAGHLLELALERGVAFLPGGPFHAVDPQLHVNNMRLSFTSTTPVEIEEGIRRIGRVLHDVLERVGGQEEERGHRAS